MSTGERLEYQINQITIVTQLEFLRDTGLDMILVDPDVDDFTEGDKTDVTTLINDRIAILEA